MKDVGTLRAAILGRWVNIITGIGDVPMFVKPRKVLDVSEAEEVFGQGEYYRLILEDVANTYLVHETSTILIY